MVLKNKLLAPHTLRMTVFSSNSTGCTHVPKRVMILVNERRHNDLWCLLLFHLFKCGIALLALLARGGNILNHIVTCDTELGAHGR